MAGEEFSSPDLEIETAELETKSEAETRQLGAELARRLEPGDVLALVGELGSGKTNFVKGLARGLGIRQVVHSPTFILANEYRSGRIPLFHVDAYRLSGESEAIGFGFDDYIDDAGVTVVEWADRIRAALPPEYLLVEFTYRDESRRAIRMTALGGRYRSLLADLLRSRAAGLPVSGPGRREDGAHG